MKVKVIFYSLLLAIVIAGSGFNPIKEIQEAAMEKRLRDLHDAKNVSYEIGEESISYTIENADGSVTVGSKIKIKDPSAVDVFGHLIDMPDGVANGMVHRIRSNPNNEPTISFKIIDTTAEKFFSELHIELSSHGFVYDDIHQTGSDRPPTFDELFASYTHPDGQQIVIMWQFTNVVFLLSE